MKRSRVAAIGARSAQNGSKSNSPVGRASGKPEKAAAAAGKSGASNKKEQNSTPRPVRLYNCFQRLRFSFICYTMNEMRIGVIIDNLHPYLLIYCSVSR